MVFAMGFRVSIYLLQGKNNKGTCSAILGSYWYMLVIFSTRWIVQPKPPKIQRLITLFPLTTEHFFQKVSSGDFT